MSAAGRWNAVRRQVRRNWVLLFRICSAAGLAAFVALLWWMGC